MDFARLAEVHVVAIAKRALCEVDKSKLAENRTVPYSTGTSTSTSTKQFISVHLFMTFHGQSTRSTA